MDLLVSDKLLHTVDMGGSHTVFLAETESPEVNERSTGNVVGSIGIGRDEHSRTEKRTEGTVFHLRQLVPVDL